MTMVSSEPARTIRPGDLLAEANFIGTAENHNTIGALVGCCAVTAPVYIGWGVRWFRERMAATPSTGCAVVFGPSNAVREIYIDLQSHLSMELRNVRDRTMELQSGKRIVFIYLEDD